MLNNFISGIVAVFIWGKTSTKTIEKILKASWIRTSIYGFFTIVVCVFFYKTYQVATVYNMIQITGFKQACDSSNQVLDTVRNMRIVHKLASSSMQQSELYTNEFKKISNHQELNQIINKVGGAYFVVRAEAHPHKFKQRKFKNVDENMQIVFNHNLDSKNIPHQNINHLYQLSYAATNIPSIIPFYPKFDFFEELDYLNRNIFCGYEVNNTRNSPYITFVTEKKATDDLSIVINEGEKNSNLPDILNNGFHFMETVGTVNIDTINYDCVELGFFGTTNTTNKLDLFTAADISQYTYMLTLNSDCPVEDLYIDYDIPIETEQVSKHMYVGTRGITFDREFVKQLQKVPSMAFHIKIPSLANLQLIRSLVLTTLLTALFSLFCKNLYYSIRKWAYNKRKKHRIPVNIARKISAKDVERIRYGVHSFKCILVCYVLLLFAIITVSTIIVVLNTSILIPPYLYEYITYLPLLLIIITIVVIYFAHKTISKPVSIALSNIGNEGVQENEEVYSSIFYHEQDEEEEYDRLVKEQLEEGGEIDSIDSYQEDNGYDGRNRNGKGSEELS